MISEPCRHRGCSRVRVGKRLVRPGEVVVHEMQGDGAGLVCHRPLSSQNYNLSKYRNSVIDIPGEPIQNSFDFNADLADMEALKELTRNLADSTLPEQPFEPSLTAALE